MKNSPTLKVGIVGCGKIALQAHLPAFRELGLKIIGVADTNKRSLSRVSGVKHKYQNYKDLLNCDLDLVSICTPPNLHYEVCVEAIEKGIHILVEKPFALTLEDALDIKKRIEKSGIKLCVVHNYKFRPLVKKAKKLCDDGTLGKLLSMHTIVHGSSPPSLGDWRANEETAGSMLLQWCHPLYLQPWFCGQPLSVFALGKNPMYDYPLMRDVRILINFKECVGFIEMSEFCASPQFKIDLVGTGGTLTLNPPIKMRLLAPNTPLNAVEDFFTSFVELLKLLRESLVMKRNATRGFLEGSHLRLIKSFVESIKTDGASPVSIEEGIMTIKLAKAIEESMYSGREVKLPV